MLVHRKLLNESMTYRARRTAIENRAFQHEQGRRTSTRTDVLTLPVVVHVVHHPQAPEQNISDEQIHSQLNVLNQDFRRSNPDVVNVPDPWRPLVADARIQFQLATVNPNGDPTDGILRIETGRRDFSWDDGVKAGATGGSDAWPSDQYLNIWVCQLGGGLLGYAQFPGGPPQTDGVVILHTAFGTMGTAAPPFDGGRTATHEIGHWLDLYHIWGDDDGACTSDDKVADTPNQAGANTGVPAFPRVTCDNGPHGDMFMNYMDYTDDVSMFMFTKGQSSRMDACLEGVRASFLVAQGTRAAAVPALVPAGMAAGDGARPGHDGNGEVARLLADSERLTTEILHDIRSAIHLVSGPG